MTRSHDGVVVDQFGPQAQAYVASAVHAGGADLDRLERIAADWPHRPASLLDLGSGGGHVSYRMAPHLEQVTAYDLSIEMLEAVRAEAARLGLHNIVTLQGPAERLPFDDGAFDLVVSRFSAHHWRDLDAGLREARRVMKPGGKAVFIDVASPGRPLLDTHLQAVELLRDPSHVRDYSVAEWLDATGGAGLAFQTCTRHRLRLEFAPWIERMRTPEANAKVIRALQSQAAEEVAAGFAIEADGSFRVDVMFLETSPA